MTSADRPTPANLAAQAARQTGTDPGAGAQGATENVRTLIDQVMEIRRSVGDDVDIAALARQSELLTAAHDELSAALRSAEQS